MEAKIILNNIEIPVKLNFEKIDDFIKKISFEFNVEKQTKVSSLSLRIDDIGEVFKQKKDFDFKGSTLLINGFQSWSKAYEYKINENQSNIRLKPGLLRFIKSDFEPKFVKKGQFCSNFYIGFNEKSLSSRNITIISLDNIYPTTYIFYKNKKRLDIGFGYDGENIYGKFTIDNLYLIDSNSYFDTKKSIKLLFNEYYEKSYNKLNKSGILDSDLSHISGWESWYNYYTSITEKQITKNVELFPSVIKSFGFKAKPVFQIDDGWEIRVGQWQQDLNKFPTPLDKIAEDIEKKGMLAGIWIAPLALLKDSDIYKNRYEWVLKDYESKPIPCGNIPLWGGDFYTYDLSIPEARKYVIEEVKKLTTTYNFKFLKLDFLYAGCVKGDNKNKEHGVAYYYNLFQKELVSNLDDNIVLLGCGAPLQLSYPFYPITRIGADTKEEWEHKLGKIAGYEGRPSAFMSLTDTINRAFMDKTIYFSDPDVGFLRKSNIKLTYREKLLINIIDFIFGSQFMISDGCDDLDEKLCKEVVSWFSLLNKKEFSVKRLSKKDTYIITEKSDDLFALINISKKNIKISKNQAEKITGKNLEKYSCILFDKEKLQTQQINYPIFLNKHDFIFIKFNKPEF